VWFIRAGIANEVQKNIWGHHINFLNQYGVPGL